MKRQKLSKEEQEIEDSLDDGQWVSLGKEELARVREMFKRTAASLKKQGRVNFRINLYDLNLLKMKAKEKEMPYQKLLGTVIHEYVTGQLVKKKVVNG
jgi:predicted DNA binding CopG/RHH family protein